MSLHSTLTTTKNIGNVGTVMMSFINQNLHSTAPGFVHTYLLQVHLNSTFAWVDCTCQGICSNVLMLLSCDGVFVTDVIDMCCQSCDFNPASL